MSAPNAGIAEVHWLALPTSSRFLILEQQQEIQVLRQENEQLRQQLTALATELSCQREQIGRSSRNSSKPPSSDGPCFKPPERRKGSGRKLGGQPEVTAAHKRQLCAAQRRRNEVEGCFRSGERKYSLELPIACLATQAETTILMHFSVGRR